ncbi:ABC transporter substrate-binding protein [Senegalia massiliensis]|uniref:ABC transporter substrate-binding protein n=1 Tax=Senegalia massiliensis TaxID=1720316 RepID=UPI0010308463|nr:ABC transporter substrate-binding protein [Senegalia massiliensis]
MKKIFILLLLVSIVFLSSCGEDKEELHVYNWGDYIDETVLDEFEKEYDVNVIYETFPTNEEMYVKIKQGGTSYDVAFPSDYMIEKMIKEDLLYKIDMNNITNYKNIDDRFKNLEFDPNNEYSVPYMWGTMGILYNKNMVEQKVDSWDILWNGKYKDEILMIDSQRDSFAVALKKLGYSLNSTDVQQLEKAKQELIKQKDLVLAYVGDEGKDMMVREEAALSVQWSGDAIYLMEENENLDYVVPKEGSNLWYDNMVIPKTSENKELAEKFIDFMTRKDIALKNTEYIGYSTPNKEAKQELPQELQKSEIAYPTEDQVKNSEVFLDPGEFLKVYDKLWTEVKASK